VSGTFSDRMVVKAMGYTTYSARANVEVKATKHF